MFQTRRLFLTTLFRAGAAIPFIPILGESVSVFLDSTKVFQPTFASIERDLIQELFARDDLFFKTLMHKDNIQIVTRNMRIPLILKPGGNFE